MLSHATNFSDTPKPSRNVRFAPPPISHDWPDSFEIMGTSMSFARNVEIYGENEPADYLYKLVSGTVRTSKILNDGRRQICAFYLPGDIFGLEVDREHALSAEAITDANVVIFNRSAVEALAVRDNDVARQLWLITAGELQRVQDHILLLIKTAEERVAGFLLEMANRIKSTNEVELPMSRQDIADYLGLTIETVSRTLRISKIVRPSRCQACAGSYSVTAQHWTA